MVLCLSLKLLFVCHECLDLLLVRQDFLRGFELASGTLRVPLGVSILDVEDAQHSVHAHREEVRVQVSDSEASDWRTMGLDLSSLLERKFPDLNCTWIRSFTLLTDSSKQNLA